MLYELPLWVHPPDHSRFFQWSLDGPARQEKLEQQVEKFNKKRDQVPGKALPCNPCTCYYLYLSSVIPRLMSWWIMLQCIREYHPVSVNNGDKPRIGGPNVNNYPLDN